MEENDGHTGLISALCRLKSRILIEGRRVLENSTPNLRARSARGAARLAAGPKLVKESFKSGSLSSSAPDESGMGEDRG